MPMSSDLAMVITTISLWYSRSCRNFQDPADRRAAVVTTLPRIALAQGDWKHDRRVRHKQEETASQRVRVRYDGLHELTMVNFKSTENDADRRPRPSAIVV
ncbi:uncharacterized protein CC84DRAFT_1166377 [Paraphaeosphaeria sporulosa]|uniref:Uncharacterized protein n=1 Tax=Paraphaeosphaeria sporulosa TaxID=1460663 RepID=A0A177C768_9PLEO|nr:uncharacterized protein CC84DRAFT_1166377 [Paraphaeosphaeria sporulosa]OAG02540.1 hypothetical protein CC84DRAFT_1166377 [Paraphaeosphaeria sporulosa]